MSQSKRDMSHLSKSDAKYSIPDVGRFFQEATQRLCGTLDMEEAFGAFFAYLNNFMQVTSITVGRIWIEQQRGEGLVLCDEHNVTLSQRQEHFSLGQMQEAANALRLRENIGDGIFAESLDDPTARFLCKISVSGMKPPLFYLPIRSVDDFFVSVIFTCFPQHPFTPEQLELLRSLRAPLLITLSNCTRFRELQYLKEHLAQENLSLRRRMGRAPDAEIVGSKNGLSAVIHQAQLVGATDIPVLIHGETGAGKEVIANAVHAFSRRAGAPFIAVNCGAIPASLIDSELFGHARGAFTGAVAEHKGYFEQAQGGTLFLDEIGELPLDVQARLLRVLQDGTINKVGGKAPVSVNFRLIAATHRDLRAMAAEGRFREDLYYRLRVVQLTVPPLRERKEDIPLLATHFLQQIARRLGIEPPVLSPEAMARLTAYAWPGNVRELRNVVEEALVLAPQGPLRFRLGDNDLEGNASAFTPVAGASADTFPSIDDVLALYLQSLLDACHGQINGPGGAAEIAGLNGNTLRFRLRKLGISFGRRH